CYLNFDYITLLSKKEVMNGLPKLKYVKDQLCSSCEMSKAKRSSFKTKAVPSSKGRLNLLHMLRLLERCFQLLSFHYHSGLKQLQPYAILRTDQSSYPLMERRHITSLMIGNLQ
ncbi:hypothetical protein Tco_0341983, partial [Tanacetum coccineum]